jgi:hypothetical protein
MAANGGCMWGFSVDFSGWIIPHTLVLWFRCFFLIFKQLKYNIMSYQLCQQNKCSYLKSCSKVHRDFDCCDLFTNKVVSDNDHKSVFFSTWDGTSGNL